MRYSKKGTRLKAKMDGIKEIRDRDGRRKGVKEGEGEKDLSEVEGGDECADLRRVDANVVLDSRNPEKDNEIIIRKMKKENKKEKRERKGEGGPVTLSAAHDVDCETPIALLGHEILGLFYNKLIKY